MINDENDANKQVEYDLLASASVIRADTERFNMFEKAADGANILANLDKRDAVVRKKKQEKQEEEEVKSYDSEDSLDMLDISVSPAPQP